ncbi:patatin-like phospholipase family protein [Aquimarina hainanensis]|uniref:Patatin-like phospholipase family protein n=1 Tax=Aquimarina hainanensis TaxID=1578017 RepID=A0ABW5N1M7_9FLAO|nr:patatin-like phospholipase family protein [Aquimarina sp. TRL1]QKX04384.1 patatin-like phospholipase family protein [Aquimarina sp. TRL1]
MNHQKKIGLVLSGGGYKGIAHLGALLAFEEAGITPQYISGSSAGAIVGALYAGGYSITAIKSFFKKTPLFRFNKFTRKKPGFLDSEKFYDDFSSFFPENTFESLQRTLFITTTNLIEGTSKVFSSGELIKPILASAAFPGIFSPIKIGNALYADGGIMDNFPITPLINHCDMILGVNVTPVKKPTAKDFKHAYNVMQRAYYLMSIANAQNNFKHCNILVEPEELVNYGIFNAYNLDKVFELGYSEAKKQLITYRANQEN